MKYLSLFSGIEAATVAWNQLEFEPVAFSEIERFPCAVLKHHYPDVPNWGDVTKYKEWPNESVDIIIGGSPCQSFSVAGLRRGLDDPRGNLILIYLAVVGKYRPKWVVWENVPGVLSSNRGWDFGTFLGGLGQFGYGVAYRVLDAQYAGVPQRRRRVFVVGHLGNWSPAATVLFERHSLQGHTPPSRKAGKRVARCLSQSLKISGRIGMSNQELPYVLAHGQGNAEICSDGEPSLTCNHEAPIIAMATKKVSQTITENCANTLYGDDYKEPQIVCFQQNASGEVRTGEVAYTLNQNSNASGRNTPMIAFAQGVLSASSVRRLTPIECERLMGLPDNYTKIPWRGKSADKCPDGPRYKALGNSMAVPVILWIGERIKAVDNILKRQNEI